MTNEKDTKKITPEKYFNDIDKAEVTNEREITDYKLTLQELSDDTAVLKLDVPELTQVAEEKSEDSELDTDRDAEIAEREERKLELKNNGLLDTGLTNTIIKQEKMKLKWAPKIILGTAIYFCLVTILIFIIIFCPIYSDTLKSVLLGGFFTNLIGLLIIIFKYIFSPSKDIYNLTLKLKKYLIDNRKSN